MCYTSFRVAMIKIKNSNISHPTFHTRFHDIFQLKQDFFPQCKQMRKALTSQAAGLNPSLKEKKRRSEGEVTKKNPDLLSEQKCAEHVF